MPGVTDLQQKRSAVIQLFLSGEKQNQILRTLSSPKYSRSLNTRENTRETIKSYIETGRITGRQRSG